MNDSRTNSCCEPARTPAAPDDAAIRRTQKLVAAGALRPLPASDMATGWFTGARRSPARMKPHVQDPCQTAS
jgi:hypothetical protein